jgi:hypothetical protein
MLNGAPLTKVAFLRKRQARRTWKVPTLSLTGSEVKSQDSHRSTVFGDAPKILLLAENQHETEMYEDELPSRISLWNPESTPRMACCSSSPTMLANNVWAENCMLNIVVTGIDCRQARKSLSPFIFVHRVPKSSNHSAFLGPTTSSTRLVAILSHLKGACIKLSLPRISL